MQEAPSFEELGKIAKGIPDHRCCKKDILSSIGCGLSIEKSEAIDDGEHVPELDELREKTYQLILLTLGK